MALIVNKKPLLFVTPTFVDYILMSYCDHNTPIMDIMHEMIYRRKTIIVFLASNKDSTYEDLLNEVAITMPLHGVTTSYSENSLLSGLLTSYTVQDWPVATCWEG